MNGEYKKRKRKSGSNQLSLRVQNICYNKNAVVEDIWKAFCVLRTKIKTDGKKYRWIEREGGWKGGGRWKKREEGGESKGEKERKKEAGKQGRKETFAHR